MAGSLEQQRRVYCLAGVPPEIQAYAMARYSRSTQSMVESVRELSAQRAQEFLNTFYFQYGHRSIADLAHLAVAIENVSILAAVRVVDEQLWDGQERSTRYQDFRRTGYVVPTGVHGSAFESGYRECADGLFNAYERLSAGLLSVLVESSPRPPDMDEQQARRILRARAFDVARYLLPLCTRTSVGQVVSARVLERQISRLMSDPLPEVREIGQELKQAAEAPAATIEGLGSGEPSAPTLVKYTAPSPYLEGTPSALRQAATETLGAMPIDQDGAAVALADEESLLDEAVSTLLYRFDPVGRSYRQIQRLVRELAEARKCEIVELSTRDRGAHDELLRVHQNGYALKFDLLMDFGSFRDLHRHRRCVQVIQGPRIAHGFDSAASVFRLGLGAAADDAAALQDVYEQALESTRVGSAVLGDPTIVEGEINGYLYPMAVRTRALFKMDAAEAAYLIEQRTAPAGHFSYRHVAWQMFEALRDRQPWLASSIRATDPNRVVDLFRR